MAKAVPKKGAGDIYTKVFKPDNKKFVEAPYYDVFGKIDIRVGEIKECRPHPESDTMYVSHVHDGKYTWVIGSKV